MFRYSVNTQNYFELENIRNKLAESGKIIEFKKTYTLKSPEIKDLNTQKFWGDVFRNKRSDFIASSVYRDKIKRIVRFLKRKKGKVLDIGFGFGVIEKELSNNSALEFYGIDISKTAVEKINKVLIGNFKFGNILKLPYDNSYFDIVLALDVLEHIPSIRTMIAYEEIVRVLKKGGIFIVTVPLNEELEQMVKRGQNPNGHFRIYTPPVLRIELSLFHFKILREDYLYAFINMYNIKRLILKVLPSGFRKPNLMIVFAQK